MPDYGQGLHPKHSTSSTPSSSRTTMAGIIRWLQIKKYQYEVTFSLYMLTPMEKFVFNMILLTLMSLLITAAVFYLPDHIYVVSNRIWYYIHGGDIHDSSSAGAVKSMGEAVVAAASSKTVAQVVKQSVESVVRNRGEL